MRDTYVTPYQRKQTPRPRPGRKPFETVCIEKLTTDWDLVDETALLRCILFLRSAWQGPHIIHQIPNMIRGLDVTKGRHSGEPDSILDDPKQLLV